MVISEKSESNVVFEMYMSGFLPSFVSTVMAVMVPNDMLPCVGPVRNGGGEAGLRGRLKF
jgi:hypothetical protein